MQPPNTPVPRGSCLGCLGGCLWHLVILIVMIGIATAIMQNVVGGVLAALLAFACIQFLAGRRARGRI